MNHIPKIPRDDLPRDPFRSAGPPPPPPATQPMLLLPASVTVMIVILVGIQIARSLLTQNQDIQVLVWFAFIPARYMTSVWSDFPGGLAADVWTFFTYALLHGSWMHLITNSVWLLAFGSAVAKRFGPLRFVAFSALAAAAGAALHLALHVGEVIPVVGASAAIAGLMAGAARFVFDAGGPLMIGGRGDPAAYRRPARSLRNTLTNRSAVVFIGIFFLINIFIGVGGAAVGGVSIAWEAHLGGFFAGLFAFRLFDPVPR